MNIESMQKMIEFDQIIERWMSLAVTNGAKQAIKNTTYFLSESQLRLNLRDTTNSRQFLEVCGTPPLTVIDEAKEIMEKAVQGDCLSPYQLERIEKVLVAVRRMKEYLSRGKRYGNSLAYYEENLDAVTDLQQEIAKQIRDGRVDDYASKQLLWIRGEIAAKEEKMKQKAQQIVQANKECMADSYSTIRNGRVCIPVKKEYKWKIQGSVIGKSSTGNTLFVEPIGVAKIYEELTLLRMEEEDEIRRVLYTLTAMAAESASAMKENIRVIEKLDYIFSKGKLSIDMNAAEPAINTERRIVLKNARHPLMDKTVNIPLQLEMGELVNGEKEETESRNGIVITGPNTGGKTVSIKTVVLTCLMAQYGLHVACEQADICMSSSFLCDIGDGQNLSENLSTFSSHIKNVLNIIEKADRDSLVIIDELGSGTDPAEGMGIAIAVLEKLRKIGCLFLVTTHYPEVKEYADRTASVINARMTFNKETLKPTYQMIIGEAGESCAFYIAEKLGMPKSMLKIAASAAYGKIAQKKGGNEEENNEKESDEKEDVGKKSASKIKKVKKAADAPSLASKYQIGDSVIIFPDKKIGIVCEPVNEKGVLRVQLPDRKIYISHKRVKLQVAASELYPENYDFSIIFDTVENRKIRHDMERKYTEAQIKYRMEE